MAASFALCSIFSAAAFPSLCGPQSTFDLCPETVAKQCPPKTYCAYQGGTYECLCTVRGLIYCPNKQRCVLTCEEEIGAPSCSDLLQEYPFLKNGIYTIATPSGDVKTFCDMAAGGWTLIGQTGQSKFDPKPDMYNTWLRSNVNVENLLTPEIELGVYSCLDSIDMAVNHATLIRLSSGDQQNAMGTKWVEWPMPEGRDVDTWWNHAIGQSAVEQTSHATVTVRDNTGSTKNCQQRIQGMYCYSGHSGGYPATETYSGCTGLARNDLCMLVPVILTGVNEHGYYNNDYSYDCPSNDNDWPNQSYTDAQNYVSVWLK